MAGARLPTGIRLKSWARMVNDRVIQRPANLSAVELDPLIPVIADIANAPTVEICQLRK